MGSKAKVRMAQEVIQALWCSEELPHKDLQYVRALARLPHDKLADAADLAYILNVTRGWDAPCDGRCNEVKDKRRCIECDVVDVVTAAVADLGKLTL